MLKRIFVTLGALALYRIGTFIPLPTVDAGLLYDPVFSYKYYSAWAGGSVTSVFDRYVGGAFGRLSLLALGVMPYLLSFALVSGIWALLRRDGNDATNPSTVRRYVQIGTIAFALACGLAVAHGLTLLEGQVGRSGLLLLSGPIFYAATAVTLASGTTLLVWLGNQITAHGIGNGIALIVFAGLTVSLASDLHSIVELWRARVLTFAVIPTGLVFITIIVTITVFLERTVRAIRVEVPKARSDGKLALGHAVQILLRFNSGGATPLILAAAVLLLPLTVLERMGNWDIDWFRGPLMILTAHAVLIIGCVFLSAALRVDVKRIARKMHKQNMFIAGIRPGHSTTAYLGRMAAGMTTVGAVYLTLLSIIPEWLKGMTAIPMYVHCAGLVILVQVMLDLLRQLRGGTVGSDKEPPDYFSSGTGVKPLPIEWEHEDQMA